MTHTITREKIVECDPCDEGLAYFDAAYPGGVAEYDPTSAEDAARILGGPLARWWPWAVEKGVAVPFLLSCGDNGTATAGYRGTATAGYRGTASAGYRGTATAGAGGTATAGVGGTATAGYRGTASAGYRGTATAGAGGTATAGISGTATAGAGGTASAGYRGTATAGAGGTATAGYRGTATAGEYGTIVLARYDGRRRLVVGYIGETLDASGRTLEPGVAYRLDDDGRFMRA